MQLERDQFYNTYDVSSFWLVTPQPEIQSNIHWHVSTVHRVHAIHIINIVKMSWMQRSRSQKTF